MTEQDRGHCTWHRNENEYEEKRMVIREIMLRNAKPSHYIEIENNIHLRVRMAQSQLQQI